MDAIEKYEQKQMLEEEEEDSLIDIASKSKEEEEEPKKEPKEEAQVVKVAEKPKNQIQRLEPEQEQEMYRLAETIHETKLAPSFGSKKAVFLAVHQALALGFKKPGEILNAIQSMYVVNDRISLFGDLPLSIVKREKALGHFDEYFISKDYKRISLENKNLGEEKFAAVCEVENLHTGEKKTFTLPASEISQGSKGKVWDKYPEIMWKRRCRRIAFLTIFPELLASCSIEEPNGKSEETKKELQAKYED